MQECFKSFKSSMDDVNYPTKTADELSNIHDMNTMRVVKDFTEEAKSLDKAALQSDLEVR